MAEAGDLPFPHWLGFHSTEKFHLLVLLFFDGKALALSMSNIHPKQLVFFLGINPDLCQLTTLPND